MKEKQQDSVVWLLPYEHRILEIASIETQQQQQATTNNNKNRASL